ncbi:MAG: NAD-dependent epimerase/dehydratase family protein [Acidimicrobiales bacterium]
MTDRLLITGASGFIGNAVVNALPEGAAEIHLVGRTESRSERPHTHTHVCDLLEPEQRRQLIADLRPTQMLHLAWCTGHGRFWTDPDNLEWQHATHDLVRLFGDAGGGRAVLIGSCAEYDWTRPGPYSEDDSKLPSTLYGRAKNATAEASMTVAEELGFSLCWAHIFNVFGPGEHRDRLVPSLCRAANRRTIGELRHPRNVVDLIHVDDLARALVMLVQSDLQGRINVASGLPTSLWQVRDVLSDLADIPGERGSLSHDVGDVVTADISRLRSELAFTPELDLRTGLESALSWWRAQTPTEEPAL